MFFIFIFSIPILDFTYPKVIQFHALHQWTSGRHSIRHHHHQQEGGVVGEDIIKEHQPFIASQDLREKGLQQGPGIDLCEQIQNVIQSSSSPGIDLCEQVTMSGNSSSLQIQNVIQS